MPRFHCGGCDRQFQHPFGPDSMGRFAWLWDDEHPRPNAGCPWCGTANIEATYWHSGTDYSWECRRSGCRKTWRGNWTRYGSPTNWRQDRWKIHVPVSTVPWASGTAADLECLRRRGLSWDSYAEVGEFHPYCCRWPKDCSAFDPGFTTGKGPTTLPIVWFDGYGWRSGPPDAKTIPQHLFDEIWARWNAVRPRNEVNDDDGDDWGYGHGIHCSEDRCYCDL